MQQQYTERSCNCSCSVCFKVLFEDLRILPACGHTFCWKCWGDNLLQQSDEQNKKEKEKELRIIVICPKCRITSILQPEPLKKLVNDNCRNEYKEVIINNENRSSSYNNEGGGSEKQNNEEKEEEKFEKLIINYDNMQFIRSFRLPFRPYYISVGQTHHLPNSNIIIISDYVNHKIHIYSLPHSTLNNITDINGESWRLVRSIGSKGNGNMQFNHPMGVAFLHHKENGDYNSSGSCDQVGGEGDRIIITDCHNHRIQIFSLECEFIRSFGSQGSDLLQFSYPHGVALMHTTSSSSKSHLIIIISDSGNHRIQIWSVEGEFIRSFGCKGNGNMQFNCPTGLTINRSSGYIIIADCGNHRIQICNVEGEFIRSIGSEGSDKFHSPISVVMIRTSSQPHNNNNHCDDDGDDQIIICDNGNNRIQIYSAKGDFIRSFGSKGNGKLQLSDPRGVTLLYNNQDECKYRSPYIIIADCCNKRIQFLGTEETEINTK